MSDEWKKQRLAPMAHNPSRITGFSMLLSGDKVTHLAHVILACLKKAPAARLKGDEAHALREIKRVLASELAQEEEIDRVVRARLSSYSRTIVEGSQEWEILYRKTFEEELRKGKRPGS
jgi:hypothetical protein